MSKNKNRGLARQNAIKRREPRNTESGLTKSQQDKSDKNTEQTLVETVLAQRGDINNFDTGEVKRITKELSKQLVKQGVKIKGEQLTEQAVERLLGIGIPAGIPTRLKSSASLAKSSREIYKLTKMLKENPKDEVKPYIEYALSQQRKKFGKAFANLIAAELHPKQAIESVSAIRKIVKNTKGEEREQKASELYKMGQTNDGAKQLIKALTGKDSARANDIAKALKST
jgi:hypothetical protein